MEIYSEGFDTSQKFVQRAMIPYMVPTEICLEGYDTTQNFV